MLAKRVTHKIVKQLAALAARSGGGSLELNIVAWNGKFPKYDIRVWTADGRPGRGITLDKKELKTLYQAAGEEISRLELLEEQRGQ